MSVLSCLLLFLCISMHACSGRHLDAIHKDSSGGAMSYLFAKDVKAAVAAKLGKTLMPLKKKQYSLSSTEALLKLQEEGKGGSMIKEGSHDESGESDKKLKESHEVEALADQEEAKEEVERRISGRDLIDKSLVSVSWRVPRKKQGSEILLSSDMGLRQSTKIQGLKSGGRRSVIGTAPHVTEETIDFKENGAHAMKDVVAMDYEPPHRKPPIHNLSP